MTIAQYIDDQRIERHATLLTLHGLILHHDHRVIPTVATMMGKLMIRYDQDGHFKYGLCAQTKLLTMHCMPIYCDATLRQKFKTQLSEARIQKGCINFPSEKPLQLPVLAQLIADCAVVNMTDAKAKLNKR